MRIPHNDNGRIFSKLPASAEAGNFIWSVLIGTAVADAQRQDLEVRRISGREADALITEIYASPPAVVKLAIEVMKE